MTEKYKVEAIAKAYFNEHLSRKAKKFILGKRIGRTRLKQLVKSVEVVENKYPEPSTILPYEFCPNCGCTATFDSGQRAHYPESWIIYYCLRCKEQVAEIDNSPFTHVLERMHNDN